MRASVTCIMHLNTRTSELPRSTSSHFVHMCKNQLTFISCVICQFQYSLLMSRYVQRSKWIRFDGEASPKHHIQALGYNLPPPFIQHLQNAENICISKGFAQVHESIAKDWRTKGIDSEKWSEFAGATSDGWTGKILGVNTGGGVNTIQEEE